MPNTNTYENIIDITLLGQFKTLLEGVMDEKDAAAIAAANVDGGTFGSYGNAE